MKIDVFRNIYNKRKANSESIAIEKKSQVPKKSIFEYAISSCF